MLMQYDYIIKVLLIGSAGVGKSSISGQFIEGHFDQESTQTIGVDLKIKVIKLNNSEKGVKIQLWDTAGHERFKSITTSYYRGADGVILVFDLSRKQSFDELSFWMDEIKSYAPKDVVFFLVGNKNDLLDRNVNINDIEKFIIDNNIKNYIEVSAKSNFNINKLFKNLTSEIFNKRINIQNNMSENPIKPSSVIIDSKEEENKKICCLTQ